MFTLVVNPIEDECIDWMVKHEKDIDLSDCAITHYTFNVVLDALKNNRPIESVNFHHCRLDSRDGQKIAETLRKNTKLLRLNLHLNNMMSTALISIASALKVNTSLRELDIGGNVAYDDGKSGRCIANALLKNKTLTHLNIDSIQFRKEDIARLLKRNATLISLSIKTYRMKLEMFKGIAEGMLENRTILHLYCSIPEKNPHLFETPKEIIEKCLKRNQILNGNLQMICVRVIKENKVDCKELFPMLRKFFDL